MNLRALCLLLLLWQAHALAQIKDLSARTEGKVFRAEVVPQWLPDGKAFWYRVMVAPKRYKYVLVQAATGEKKVAADLKSLGLPVDETKSSELPIEMRPSRDGGVETSLYFTNEWSKDVDLFWLNQRGDRVRYGGLRAGMEKEFHTYSGHVWLITSSTGEPLATVEATAAQRVVVIDGEGIRPKKDKPASDGVRGTVSPDGAWSAWQENNQVMLKNLTSQNTQTVGEKRPYRGAVQWAPDSSCFVVSETEHVVRHVVSIVESSPRGQLEPKLKQMDYFKPGDELPKPQLRIFSTSGQVIKVNSDLFPHPFTEQDWIRVRWSADSREFSFSYNQRGHKLYRLLAVNAQTGAVRTVVEEVAETFIDYQAKTWRQWLDQTKELLWMSERDGWAHLWLYDAATGKVKKQITSGQWPVREVLHVDEEERQLWFMASGLRKGEDPYHLHLCRVNLDGTGLVQLTEGEGNHQVGFSPQRDYFTATWSRADHAPVHELRRSEDGKLICVLERAEVSELLAAGWTLPERIVSMGRDGQTEIHGQLIKPSHFDPKKRYPVLEEVYAGPHSAYTPKEFSRQLRLHEMAELGFIVVRSDGMGTNHRGKAFHDVAWKNIKDAGFPDRIAWIKEVAKTRPWMDLSRVGIYGGSAGGQNAMRALLDYADFYHVAVADCGCHDNRMDKIWWNEQWMGWPVDESYKLSSNLEDAAKLKGQLLLIVGELDTNVDPATTSQIVGALQRAGKSFEFMPIIGAGHGAAETPYGSRVRAEFLVKHLKP